MIATVALTRLSVVIAVVAGLAPPEASPQEVNARADEILSRPEFAEPDKGPLDAVFDWLNERLAELLGDLTGGGGSSLFTWIVLGLFVAGVVAVVVKMGRTARRDPGTEVVQQSETRRTSRDWRAEAERYEAAGDWRRALRARYRALVVSLIERGVLRDVPGRTTGEFRAEVREHVPEVAAEFAGASELFERAWYGNLPTGPDEAHRFAELAARVSEGARR